MRIRCRLTACVTACQSHSIHVCRETYWGKIGVDFPTWPCQSVPYRQLPRSLRGRCVTRDVAASWEIAPRFNLSVGLRPCPRHARIAFRTRGKCVVDFQNCLVNRRRIATSLLSLLRCCLTPTYGVRGSSAYFTPSALAALTLRSLRTLRSKSDTLETRTKLTSHSALEPGGLPGRSLPCFTS